MMMCSKLFVVLSFLMLPCTECTGSFLGRKTQISTVELRAEVTSVMNEVWGGGRGVAQPRIEQMRSTLKPLFEALPKNSQDRISAPVMRYAVRRYFSQGYSWVVKGFEPHADPMSASNSEETILQSKAPGYIRSLVEEQFARDGFSLSDLVAVVASLERLAFDEVMKSAEIAFWLNSVATSTTLNRTSMVELLASYIMVEVLEGDADTPEGHRQEQEKIEELYPNWGEAMTFLMDITGSDDFSRKPTSNPFKVHEEYRFEDFLRMAERISQEFGFWSSYECQDMKNTLSHEDVHGTGRVRLIDFYRLSANGAWQFLEPSSLLRYNGALDESSSYLGPQVMIANYVQGMSNCLTSARSETYYAICCLHECDRVFQHLEGELLKPKATAAEILAVIEAMPQSPDITDSHRSKLEAIAHHHGSMIPIHGRLMAQWLHFVFPHECPYPHVANTVNPKTPVQWREESGDTSMAVTQKEIAEHNQAVFSERGASPEAGEEMWILEEVLMPETTLSDSANLPISKLLTVAAQVGVLGAFAGIALKEVMKISHPSAYTLKGVQYDV